MGVFYFGMIYLCFSGKLPKNILIACGAALLSHLVLDDMSYWIYLLGIGSNPRPQIFWLFPLDPRISAEINKFWERYNQIPYTSKDFLTTYVSKIPFLFLEEIGLIVGAVVVKIYRFFVTKK